MTLRVILAGQMVKMNAMMPAVKSEKETSRRSVDGCVRTTWMRTSRVGGLGGSDGGGETGG